MLEFFPTNFQHFQHARIIKFMIIIALLSLYVLEVFHRVGSVCASMQVIEGFILNCGDAG